jgi:predicted HTH transcriptional regulator
MKPLKIFISSVQKEFESERKALAQYIRTDALLGTFFEVFLFEEMAANSHTASQVYLAEVAAAHIYVGLLGIEYGFEDTQGISPTEHEYDEAKKQLLQKWVYIKGHADENRLPKELNFIKKVGDDVSRKRFETIEDLKKEVYNSCVRYLKQTGKINTHEFDESINSEATLEDINPLLIQQFVRSARAKRNFPLQETATVEQVLIHLNLIRNHQITNSAILAFGKNPQRFFTTATVKCAHFHGLIVEKPIPDYKEFSGTAFEMAERAVDFVLSKISLSTGTRESSNQVSTTYEIPRRAIAEAIINAVAHRDYYSKASIQVSVFKNRIEVFNPGSLPDELELSDLPNVHGSYPHNPLLANCMFLTGDIEPYGTGILEMIKLSKQADLITPEFFVNEGFKVILWRPSALADPKNTHHKILKTDYDTDHDTDYDTDHDTDHNKLETTELMRRLVMVLKGEKSRQDLMNKLDLRHIPSFRELYLQPSLDVGLIEMTQPDKPKSKSQNYRLTKKGIDLKKMKK